MLLYMCICINIWISVCICDVWVCMYVYVCICVHRSTSVYVFVAGALVDVSKHLYNYTEICHLLHFFLRIACLPLSYHYNRLFLPTRFRTLFARLLVFCALKFKFTVTARCSICVMRKCAKFVTETLCCELHFVSSSFLLIYAPFYSVSPLIPAPYFLPTHRLIHSVSSHPHNTHLIIIHSH